MNDREGLRLSLPARSENVAVVRHAVAGLAEAIGMSESKVADLKTVVTEACMNVVLHAYDEAEEGPLEVLATPDEGGLVLRVRDFGTGIRPRADVERASLRLGLPLIAALSSSFEIRGGLGQGTEITMRLPLAANGTDPAADDATKSAAEPSPEVTIGTELTAPGDLVGPVVSRVVSMLAARRDFSVDRVSDAMLIGDAISAFAPQGFSGGPVHLMIEDGDGTVDLRVGPMSAGAGERLRRELEVPELGASIERLADEVEVVKDDQGEYLTLKVAPASQPG